MAWFESRLLLGLRRGAHGAGSWSFPGGHLEFGESWADCASRELAEETGLTLVSPHFVAATNDVFLAENKHYLTLFIEGRATTKQAERREPDKCEVWQWFEWSSLPSPLFLPIQNLLASGYVPTPNVATD